MLQEAPQERLQAVRSVHKSQRPSSVVHVDTDDVFYIDCHIDPDTKKEFVLWDDIVQAFEGALHVRHKARMVPFVKGDDLRPIEPRRIPAFPDTVLDVVVGGELATVSPLQSTPQERPQETSAPIALGEETQDNTPRRNPVYGLEEEAMANYNHIDRPAAVPLSKTPQEQSQETSAPIALGEEIQDTIPRRNPVYGLEEEAMANYNHIDRPDSAPLPKTSQEQSQETPTPIALGEEIQDNIPRRNPVYGLEEEAMANYNHIDRPVAAPLSMTPQERSQESPQNKLTTTRRNPVYGHVEEAMENYNHIDRPAVPSSRGPQAIERDLSDNNESTGIRLAITNSRPRAPQDQAAAAAANDRVSIIVKATLGDRDSQVALGDMHRTGNGVDKDYQAAHHWYLKAANDGDPSAQNSIGDLYRLGLGAPPDHSKALEWYLKAAEQGDAAGQYHMGHMHHYGLCVSQNYQRAMDWYLKAGDQGYASAQCSIGELYAKGQGLPKDYAKALEWYRKAADQDFAEAHLSIRRMNENDQGVLQETDAGEEHNVDYLHAQGVEAMELSNDPSKAFEWFLKAAQHGHVGAQENVGIMFYKGQGVSQDYSHAMEWLVKVASQDYARAQHLVGAMYYHGRGVPRDFSVAFEWLLKAADQGYAAAQSDVAVMYCYGQGVAQDFSVARKWLSKAAIQGRSHAQVELGSLYHYGGGVAKNYDQAKE
ncbi:hypothetical protein BGX29_011225, partial [Mortierella sp. GBA35]